MKYSLLIICVILCFSCQSQQDRIVGEWAVKNLSEYPLSITHYGDIKFNKSSRVLFDNEQLTVYTSDSLMDKERFNYSIEDGELIIMYSDYGIPLEIKKLTKNTLVLYGGGFGNTDEERSRHFEIELKR